MDSKCALIGQTGCGKSTFLKLLSGYYKPTSGSILINGREVSFADYSDVVTRAYPVLQDAHVFNLFLKDEIQLYDKQNETIDTRMQLAEISELKSRIEEHVGNNGCELSGGQRQRVILTRIFNGERDLVILDESTSALDAETEKKILENVWKYFDKSIVVVCTHNDAILSKFDKLLVMQEGKISCKTAVVSVL